MAATGETDYYAVLEVTATATAGDIRQAYKRLALLRHPDKNVHNNRAHEVFVELRCAAEVLGDPVKRANYDRTRNQEASRRLEEAERQRRQQEEVKKKEEVERRRQEKQARADQARKAEQEKARQSDYARRQLELERNILRVSKGNLRLFARTQANLLHLWDEGRESGLDEYERQETARRSRQEKWEQLDLVSWKTNWSHHGEFSFGFDFDFDINSPDKCAAVLSRQRDGKEARLWSYEAEYMNALLAWMNEFMCNWEAARTTFANRAAQIKSLKPITGLSKPNFLISELQTAVKSNYTNMVHCILDCGADVNASQALAIAVRDQNVEMVALLLKEGASPDICDSNDNNPLHFAASHADCRIALLLISASTRSLNRKNKNLNTPLLIASGLGRLQMIHLLLSAGADPTITNVDGYTILHICSRIFSGWWSCRRKEFIDLLGHIICCGVSPNARSNDGTLAAALVKVSKGVSPMILDRPWPGPPQPDFNYVDDALGIKAQPNDDRYKYIGSLEKLAAQFSAVVPISG